MSKRPHKRGTNRSEQRSLRRQDVRKLLCAWVSYNEICDRMQARYGVCRKTVEKDIAEIRKTWRIDAQRRDVDIVFDQVFESLSKLHVECTTQSTPVDRRTRRSIILDIAKLYGILERQGERTAPTVTFEWAGLPVDDGDGPADEDLKQEYLEAVEDRAADDE